MILTNPDMLHLGILPNHRAWADVFANLAVVVVDEAHVYRGVFGSHVANVLRRLRRIAAAYGTEPRFLLASATIANPGELAERLTGLPEVTVIDRDGSPGARKTIAMWNPPITDEQLATRRSALAEAADLLAELVGQGARTIVFMKSRKAVELIARFAAARARGPRARRAGERIAPYRAGYTPQQRRELERRLVDGELLGVVSTDALELGIDIGSLDAAICVTFPGTVASLRQMWGRAGRRGRGLARLRRGRGRARPVLLPPPDEFLDRPVEAAILDPFNEQIHAAHVLCAGARGAARAGRRRVAGAGAVELTAGAARGGGELRRRPGGTWVPRDAGEYPAGAVSLRSTGRDGLLDRRGRLGRAARDRRRRRARSTRRTRARCTCTAGARSRSRQLDLELRRRWCGRSTATGTRRPSARPTCTSSGSTTGASGSA